MSNNSYSGDGKDRFTRSRGNRMLGGLCASLADRMGLDVSLVRILTVVLSLFSSGALALVYLIAWVIVPEEPILNKN